MVSAVVEFLGGPLDGKIRDLEVDDEGMPIPEITLAVPRSHPFLPFVNGGRVEVMQPDVLVYERHPSPRAHGPLWLYILQGLDL